MAAPVNTERGPARGAVTGGGLRLGRAGVLAYALAWLGYLAVFIVVLSSVPQYGAAEVLAGAFANVLPPALLGLVVIRHQPLVPWEPARWRGFFSLQIAAGLLFAALGTAVTWAIFSAVTSFEAGRLTPAAVRPEVVAQQLFLALIAFVVITVVRYAIDIQRHLHRQEQRAARAETLRASAELEALRAQLNPHFLFNTLHSLLAVIRRDANEAEDALERFATLLRFTLQVQHRGEGLVMLADEWAFVENYLALESLRLGERLKVELNAERDALACEVPVFLLQPLVENVVRHGIAPKPAGGTVSITAGVGNDTLYVTIADDGPGAATGRLEAGDGLGLRLVRERLTRTAGEGGRLHMESAPGRGFVARIEVPLEP